MKQPTPCDEHHFYTLPPDAANPHGFRTVAFCPVCGINIAGTVLIVRMPPCLQHLHEGM